MEEMLITQKKRERKGNWVTKYKELDNPPFYEARLIIIKIAAYFLVIFNYKK